MKTDKLAILEENIKTLKKIKDNYKLEDIIADKIDEWGLRYGLFESIQIIIDLACHIAADKNLGAPKNYSECISLLISNNYVKKDLGNNLIKMVGLRNLLVHDYGIIDVNKLFEYLNYLGDMSDFVYAIKGV